LAYRIPQSFDHSSTPCAFTYRSFDGLVENWVKLPKKRAGSITVSNDESIDYGYFGFDQGRKLDFYLKDPTTPIFSVHCSIFSDSTLIGVTTPHVFNDAKGMAEIMHAWASVVNHGIDSVRELPVHHDPWSLMEKTALPSKDGTTLKTTGWKVWTPWQFIAFVCRMVWETLWQPRESSRILHIPKAELEKLRCACKKELEDEVSLSINDVLVAWLAKTAFSAHSSSDRTSITIALAADIRRRLQATPFFSQPYIHNASLVVVVHPPLTIADLQTLSVAQVATRIHDAVSQQLKEEDAAKLVAETIQSARRGERLMAFAHDGLPFLSTNWSNNRFGDASFEGALVNRGETGRTDEIRAHTEKGRAGKLCLTLTAMSSTIPLRRSSAILHREDDGSLWVKMTLSDRVWERLELRSGASLIS
jgi:hypothetical protein